MRYLINIYIMDLEEYTLTDSPRSVHTWADKATTSTQERVKYILPDWASTNNFEESRRAWTKEYWFGDTRYS